MVGVPATGGDPRLVMMAAESRSVSPSAPRERRMGSRVFLGVSALVWFPYGLLCLAKPSILENTAGVVASTVTGTVELRAMYGGLQVAIGALCTLGCVSRAWRTCALTSLGVLTAGLGLGRIVGVTAGGGLSSYTAAALGFELVSAVLAFTLARNEEGVLQ